MWFSGVLNMSKEIVFGAFETGFLFTFINSILSAALTCIFALGGSIIGTIIGAMKGQTYETGLVHGAGIGAITGAITAIQLLESLANGEPLSKTAFLMSLVNGKIISEWISPALLKAYQGQSGTLETTFREASYLYDVCEVKGLSRNLIQKLPECRINSEKFICCSICLQDFGDGDLARELPKCGHVYHLDCIDRWLTINGSCPVCRRCVFEDDS